MQGYQHHGQYPTKRAATLLQELPKPESVDDFTYRRLAHVEFHPLLDQLSYTWLWSAADEGYLVLPINPLGAGADRSWNLINEAEWQDFQRTQFGLIDSIPPERLEALQPVGWGCTTDVLLDFKMRADAAREPDKRY